MRVFRCGHGNVAEWSVRIVNEECELLTLFSIAFVERLICSLDELSVVDDKNSAMNCFAKDISVGSTRANLDRMIPPNVFHLARGRGCSKNDVVAENDEPHRFNPAFGRKERDRCSGLRRELPLLRPKRE